MITGFNHGSLRRIRNPRCERQMDAGYEGRELAPLPADKQRVHNPPKRLTPIEAPPSHATAVASISIMMLG